MFDPNNKRLRVRGDREEAVEESLPGRLVLPNARSFFGVGWRSHIKFSSGDEDEVSEAECEMEIVNNFDETVLICWIDPMGTLRNFYPVNDGSIKDGSVSNKHAEFTFRNHSFVVIRQSNPLPKKVKDIKKENFLLAYTPLKPKHRHYITMSKPPPSSGSSQFRGRKIVDVTLESSPIESDEDNHLIVSANKEYLCKTICGFLVNYEPDVFDTCPTLEEALSEDLTQLNNLMPPAASKKLQAGTALWVNKTLTYGTVKKPVQGKACTFYPLGGSEWLRKMGMNPCKEGSIELYDAAAYLECRSLWGVGGVIIHEFAHAFHNKHCPDGYDCSDIRETYNIAMKKKLYDKVPLVGVQGKDGFPKAYACASCREYFAELSVAYHWTSDGTTEYNNWHPYNRNMLITHDSNSRRGFAGDATNDSSAKGAVMNMDMMKYESSRLEMDDDHDWCEDSMAVELSSVDSTALNDFRSCGFSVPAQATGSNTVTNESKVTGTEVVDSNLSGSNNGEDMNIGDSDGGGIPESQFSPLLQDPQQQQQQQQQQQGAAKDNGFECDNSNIGSNCTEVKSIPLGGNFTSAYSTIEESTKLEAPSVIDTTGNPKNSSNDHTYSICETSSGKYETVQASGSSFMALADATRASDWLQQAAVAAASANAANYQPYVQSMLGSFFYKDIRDRVGTGWDSDRSIATSLFVEVESVDEDGSYQGYGKATGGDIDFVFERLEGDGRYGAYANIGSVDCPTMSSTHQAGHGHAHATLEEQTQTKLSSGALGSLNRMGIGAMALVGEGSESLPIYRRPFSSLSVCDSDDDYNIGSTKSVHGEDRQKSSQRYSTGISCDGRYRKHHSSSSTHSVLIKRKRQGNRTVSSELPALSPPFEVPSASFRQQFFIQKKSVGFGIGTGGLGAQANTGHHYNVNSKSDGGIVDRNINVGDLPYHDHSSSPLVIHLRSPASNDTMNDTKTVHSSGNSSIGSLTEVTSHHKVSKPSSSKDPVEDGYDGASETGRCETDGMDEFESENESYSIAPNSGEHSESSALWNQSMDIQQLSCNEASNSSSSSTKKDTEFLNIYQEFDCTAGAAQSGNSSKRRVRSRKNGLSCSNGGNGNGNGNGNGHFDSSTRLREYA